jgi:predicted phosphodiesterase
VVRSIRQGRARLALLWLGRALLVTAVALCGVGLGLRAAGPVARETPLGSISFRVAAAWHGEVDAFIPIADWGVRARVFNAPVRLHVEPRRVDRQALLNAVEGDRAVLRRTEKRAGDAAHEALVRAFRWTIAGALVAGGILALALAAFRRGSGWSLAAWSLAPAVLAAALGLGIIARTGSTFDAGGFERPSFYARGAELAQVLQVSEKAQEAKKGYEGSVQRTISGYATLLTAGAKLSPVESAAPSVLISDLHGNAPVLSSLRRLFSGRPVFFPGDFGHTGSDAEARALVPRVTALGRPLVAVSGNHDSRGFMRRLAGAGALVLTERGRLLRSGKTNGVAVQDVDGFKVAGYADPLEWRGPDPTDPKRIFSFAERPNGDREYAAVQAALVRWFDRLEPRPEIVLIHQNGLAQHLARTLHDRGERRPLLVLTGHDHRQHLDRYGNTVVVDAGTLGAGGLFGVGRESVGIATLYFDGERPVPHAVDLIQVEPLSGAARADRVIVASPEACELENVRCHDEKDRGGPARS